MPWARHTGIIAGKRVSASNSGISIGCCVRHTTPPGESSGVSSGPRSESRAGPGSKMCSRIASAAGSCRRMVM